LRSYKPVDWGAVRYDFLHWGVAELGGWPLAEIPSWMLLQGWKELVKREQRRANDYNHTGAILVGIKQTKEGRPIEWGRYLPYPDKSSERELSPMIQRIVNRLITEDRLPAAMVADFYNQKLLPKPK
jgi:hypothetical protein